MLKDNKASIGEMAAYFESIEIKSVYLQWRIFGAGGQESIRQRASVIESLRSRLPIDYANTNSTVASAIEEGLEKCNHGSGVPYYRQGKSLTKVGACSRVNIHRCEQKDVAVGFAAAVLDDEAFRELTFKEQDGLAKYPHNEPARKKEREVLVDGKVRQRREMSSALLVRSCVCTLSHLVLFKLTP